MTNSTTAFIIFVLLVIGHFIKSSPEMFIGACIFSASCLIINQIKESSKK